MKYWQLLWYFMPKKGKSGLRNKALGSWLFASFFLKLRTTDLGRKSLTLFSSRVYVPKISTPTRACLTTFSWVIFRPLKTDDTAGAGYCKRPRPAFVGGSYRGWTNDYPPRWGYSSFSLHAEAAENVFPQYASNYSISTLPTGRGGGIWHRPSPKRHTNSEHRGR